MHQLVEDAANKHVNVSSIAAALMHLKDPKSGYGARSLRHLRINETFYRKGCSKFLRRTFFKSNARVFDANLGYLASVRQRCVDYALSHPHINPKSAAFPVCFPAAWTAWNTIPLDFDRGNDSTLIPESNVFAPDVLELAESSTARLQDVLCEVLYEDVLGFCQSSRSRVSSV